MSTCLYHLIYLLSKALKQSIWASLQGPYNPQLPDCNFNFRRNILLYAVFMDLNRIFLANSVCFHDSQLAFSFSHACTFVVFVQLLFTLFKTMLHGSWELLRAPWRWGAPWQGSGPWDGINGWKAYKYVLTLPRLAETRDSRKRCVLSLEWKREGVIDAKLPTVSAHYTCYFSVFCNL